MKKITKQYSLPFLVAALLLVGACNRPYEKVYATYDNGNPKLVFTLVDNRDGNPDRIGEKSYYEDGQLRYEKHFKEGRPSGEWTFYYANGKMHAKGTFNTNDTMGTDWKFYNDKGEDFYQEDYDSMRVLDFTADHRPLSVAYYKGDEEMRFQFNDNFTLNTKGMVKGGAKEGRWEFYYADGTLRMEAVYSHDLRNGAYNSYRENGIPYFRGFYINDQRANIWEFYDEAGNLAGRQDYDKH